MVALRRTELRGEVEYFLDGAVEAAEMDGCTGMTLRLYGDNDAMRQIMDLNGPFVPASHYKNRRMRCLELADLADTILAELPVERRAGLIAMGMKHLTYEIANLAETMAYMCIEDQIEGGCLENFLDRPRENRGVTWKRTDRRLRSPKFIRRYVKGHAADAADQLIKLHAIMMRRVQHTKPAHDPTINQDYRSQIEAYRVENQRRINLLTEPNLPFREMRRRIRKERKVIRRSLDIALNLLGRETVASFLHGETVKLLGQETMLMLRKRGRLAQCGHGALSVVLADAAGTQLADLCTYIEKTPTLDQLVGFALWMNAGEEKHVLETANIVKLSEGASYDHPLLAARQEAKSAQVLAELTPRDRATITDMINGRQRHGRIRPYLTYDERRERNRRYSEETKGEWTEALMVAVIGYRNFPIYRVAGAL